MQTTLNESLKPDKWSWLSLKPLKNMFHLLLKPVVSLSGRHWGAPHLVFKGHAFRIVFGKPCLRGIGISKDLDMFEVSDLLARIHVDQHCHWWIHPADREAAPAWA